MLFRDMHHAESPLLICNIWDARSAIIAQQLGFQAIGTSSAAIATSRGHEDGEHIRFEQVCSVVSNIRHATTLPLTVDIESGSCRNQRSY